jgi:hypothetical protein
MSVESPFLALLDANPALGAAPGWRRWSRRARAELAAVAWRLAVTSLCRADRRGVAPGLESIAPASQWAWG